MAFDVLKGKQGGRDWSCGIGDEPTSTSGGEAGWAAIAAGAAAIAVTAAGVVIASSLGGKSRTRTSTPPTMMLTPHQRGYSINPAARRYFRG